MLTGQADMQATVDAVNEGSLFRFLTKPCPTHLLIKALSDGIEQYRLITSERELLEKTLKGSIRLLVEILSILSPVAFSQTTRIRNLAKKLAIRLNVEDKLELDLALMLSQIGCVTIPAQILEKKFRGEVLEDSEFELFLSHPLVGGKLLSNIPRLEKIAQAVTYQEKLYDGSGIPKDNKKGTAIPLISRIMKVVIDFNSLLNSGKNAEHAVEIMRNRRTWYDPVIFGAFEAEIMELKEGYIVKAIKLDDIKTGMVLGEDIKDVTGKVLVTKGNELTEVLITRLLNYNQLGKVAEPIKVVARVKKII